MLQFQLCGRDGFNWEKGGTSLNLFCPFSGSSKAQSA